MTRYNNMSPSKDDTISRLQNEEIPAQHLLHTLYEHVKEYEDSGGEITRKS